MKKNNLPKLSFAQLEQQMSMLTTSEKMSLYGGTDGPPRNDCFFATLAGLLNTLDLPLSYSSSSLQSQYTSIIGSAPTNGANVTNQLTFLGTATANQNCPYDFAGAVKHDGFSSSQMGSYISSNFSSGDPMMVSYNNPHLNVSHAYKVKSVSSDGTMVLEDISGQGFANVTINKNDTGITSTYKILKKPGVTSANAADPGSIQDVPDTTMFFDTTTAFPTTTEFFTTTEFQI